LMKALDDSDANVRHCVAEALRAIKAEKKRDPK